jgi:hypothetical protein
VCIGAAYAYIDEQGTKEQQAFLEALNDTLNSDKMRISIPTKAFIILTTYQTIYEVFTSTVTTTTPACRPGCEYKFANVMPLAVHVDHNVDIKR